MGLFAGLGGYAQNMVITGIFDGPLSSAPRGLEIYVLNNIADLSLYGVGSANNGGGTDGQEFTFPAISATAGDYIYITNNAVSFVDFFGFAADYEDPTAGISGDDAFELFFNGSVIDVFGEISVSGGGQPWEYTDGWVYRKDCTGPDGTIFLLANWTYSGLDVFDGATTNATSSSPFPLGTYAPTGCVGVETADIVITEIMYNSPQISDIEFIELYNNDVVPVNLAGYVLSSAVDGVLPSIILNPGEYAVLTDEQVGFTATYGFAADYEWTSGVLSNTSATIVLVDSNGNTVDFVSYDDGGLWPSIADGGGPSLTLCDPSSDNNDPANWQRSTTNTGVLEDNKVIFASPNAGATCLAVPIVQLEYVEASVLETGVSIEVQVLIDNPNALPTSVDLLVGGGSTASSPADYTITSPSTITFPGDSSANQTIVISINDDLLEEGTETIRIRLVNPTNGAVIASAAAVINILDDEAPLTKALVLTGLFHGPISGNPKGVEVFVAQDIADLSIFGVGTANNGGGTDGQEYTFPAVPATAGEYLYVANDTVVFRTFFGQGANFLDPGGVAMNFNGDDAVELFENGQVIDVFGDINVDGTGQPWEYTLSWAHRIAGGPDDATFVLANWELGPLEVFDTVLTNAAAAFPFPIYTGPPLCNSANVPDNQTHLTLANRVQLDWDPIPGAVGCQVRGKRLPTGPQPTVNVLASPYNTVNVPFAVAGAGTTWTWQVRCACTITPLDVSAFSAFGDTFSIPVAREMAPAATLNLFPNPASDQVYVNWNANSDQTVVVEVYNITGTLVMSLQKAVMQGANALELDVKQLEEGIYFLTINGVDSEQFSVLR